MPLTKEYLRYKPNVNFNIIASRGCRPALVNLQGQEGRFVAVGACEEIIVWDLQIGEKVFYSNSLNVFINNIFKL